MERPAWDRIQEIYHSTLPMPPSERGAYIASACDNDPVLMREVASLLKADESAEGFLETSVFELGLKIISSDSLSKSTVVNSSADSLVGVTIDQKYLVERVLGRGGMGQVYFARDLTLHSRPVVIKILLEASVKDDYVVKKFRQEVEALARIDHPGVVNVLGSGNLPDGKPYIVMQYVNGVTLRSQILTEGMELERAAQILKQIGAALEHVHEQRIFHRDLKPENIMLQSLTGGTELVKVVDFGIAKVKDSVVAPSTVDKVPVGTVLYMSPEQLRGGERITAASDIYAMGVIAYEMVTGRRPFTPTSAPQLLELHRGGVRVKPTDLRNNLSTEAQAIILHALSFEREDRYQSAAEFGDSLARALLNEEETRPRPTTPRQTAYFTKPDNFSDSSSEEPQRPFGLGKIQLAVIGGFLILLVAILVVLWTIQKPREGTTNTETTANSSENPAPTHSFIYSLTVQRMRDNKPYEAAFQSTDQDVFDTGDKFRLTVSSSSTGYVYVFNEGTPEPNGSSFTILYPTPLTNEGSATLGADQKVQTNWNTFRGQAGTENFWIAWSIAPVPELESGKKEAFKRNGVLTGDSLDSVKAYLRAKELESNPKISRDKDRQQTTVRGTGIVVVKMLRFVHR
jgi:serine/threonine protein kinase